MKKRAVLYARVSGDDRKYATSGIDSQLADCRKYAEEKQYLVVNECCETRDKQTSGAAWLPELDKIVKSAKQGQFDVLIVREIDRLARNRFKQLSIEIKLQSMGVTVEYVIGQFEDSAEGRLLKGLMSEFAEYEREKIKERTIRGIEQSVRAGNVKIGGSYAPYGYEITVLNGRRTLKINEVEAAVVMLIFDLFVNQGYTIHAICAYLDAHNVPKPAKGNNHKARTYKVRKLGWGIGTLFYMLKNETYVGRWYYRKTKVIKDPLTGKRKRIKRPRDKWLLVEVPAILTEDIFQKAQKRLVENKKRMGKRRKHFYALGGMLQCGHCKNGMTGLTRPEGYQYYVCNARQNPGRYGIECDNANYNLSKVDAAIWYWIKSVLLSPDRLEQSIQNFQDTQRASVNPLISMIEANEAEQEKLLEEKQRLVKAYSTGVLTLDEIAFQKADLEKRIKDITEAIEMLKDELTPKLLSQVDIEAIQKRASDVRDEADLTDDDPQTQRELFQLLDVHVVLSQIDGEKWADLTCVLGEKRLPVDFNTQLMTGVGSCPQEV